jgi:hypothetical protein
MFLRAKIRRKDGKEHRAWSVVENRRIRDGRVVQRQVLISHDGQWRRAHGIWGSIADAPGRSAPPELERCAASS